MLKAKSLACSLALFATGSLLLADEANTFSYDLPPQAAFTEKTPAYTYIKKVEIERKARANYEFTITLYGEIPTNFTKSGLNVWVCFDFADLKTDKPSMSGRKDFENDIFVELYREPGSAKFLCYNLDILRSKYDGKTYSLDVVGLQARKDTINFTVRSPLFAENMPTRVLFVVRPMVHGKHTDSTPATNEGSFTPPMALNKESQSLTAAQSAAPAASPSPSPSSSPAKAFPSLNIQIKP